MDKNRKKSCTGNSSYIDIRYLFAKERVDINNMSITYCFTSHNLAYFFTKALQGALFVNFGKVITGWKRIDNLQMGLPSTNECAENVDRVKSIK